MGKTSRRRSTWPLSLSLAGAALASLPVIVFAFETGPPIRVTGGTGDSGTCANGGCHTGTPDSGGGKVTATFSTGSVYTPGTPVTISVSVQDPQNPHYGFQMSARVASDLGRGGAGDFTPGPNQQVLCDNGALKPSVGCPSNYSVQFIEHAYPAQSQVSTTPYTFTWMPPATNVGPVTFYVVGNAVNGDLRADSRDHVYTATYVLSPSSGPSVAAIVSASDFGAIGTFASGSWLEIYGTSLAASTDTWTNYFSGPNAPTKVGQTSVTINGKPAFIDYVGPTQINIQAPADSTLGTVPVAVTTNGLTSTFMLAKTAVAPGFLSPARYAQNNRQYLFAVLSDGGYAGNPSVVPGTSRPARPGETIVLYGTGFGDAKDSTNTVVPPGVVVSQTNTLTNPITVKFGATPATITFQGLSQGSIGLYQFNLIVPPSLSNGDQILIVTQAGQPIAQTLFLNVHN